MIKLGKLRSYTILYIHYVFVFVHKCKYSEYEHNAHYTNQSKKVKTTPSYYKNSVLTKSYWVIYIGKHINFQTTNEKPKKHEYQDKENIRYHCSFMLCNSSKLFS